MTRQCLEVAICDVYDYMTWDYPEAIRGYEELTRIMQTLKDAYEALSVQEIVNPVFIVADKIQAAKIDGSCECDCDCHLPNWPCIMYGPCWCMCEGWE